MTIEIAIVLSAISLIFSIISGVSGMKRNARTEDKNDASQLTTVIVKLENIGNDIKEIKTDLRDVKADIQSHAEKLIKIEQQIKVLNKTVFKNDKVND